jgi:nickel-type superoxide dismutase maturation protease
MAPTLLPGDRVLVWRGLGRRSPAVHPGDLVAVVDPRDPGRMMVKRVARVAGPDIFVEGDNATASTDSRHFGPVRPSAVAGRVVYRYCPEERRGRLA